MMVRPSRDIKSGHDITASGQIVARAKLSVQVQ
jgi:hypothetical protein